MVVYSNNLLMIFIECIGMNNLCDNVTIISKYMHYRSTLHTLLNTFRRNKYYAILK